PARIDVYTYGWGWYDFRHFSRGFSPTLPRSIKEDHRMDARGMNRRHFLKVSGTAAVAVTGIERILASRQAPAYAQGTKLHRARWAAFIPASDVERKRQMPEASKAPGAEVTLETINANDLQPRITAAIQSGSGADIFNFQYNWPHLYQNAVVDVSDVANDLSKAENGFYEIYPPSCQVNGQWLRLPPHTLGNTGGDTAQ